MELEHALVGDQRIALRRGRRTRCRAPREPRRRRRGHGHRRFLRTATGAARRGPGSRRRPERVAGPYARRVPRLRRPRPRGGRSAHAPSSALRIAGVSTAPPPSASTAGRFWRERRQRPFRLDHAEARSRLPARTAPGSTAAATRSISRSRSRNSRPIRSATWSADRRLPRAHEADERDVPVYRGCHGMRSR